MLRLLLLLSTLAACTPSPRKDVMPSPDPISGIAVQGSSAAAPEPGPAAQAAQGPIPEPVSAAGVSARAMPPAPASLTDSPAAALGRRALSTAFVRVGPDGHLTVERHDGRAMVLRDVSMSPGKYCGAQVSGARYCGDYAEIAAARPGGAPLSEEPDRAAANPVAPGGDPAGR